MQTFCEVVVVFSVVQPALITVCGGNMMYRWCMEQEEGQEAPELVLDRSYKFQGGL